MLPLNILAFPITTVYPAHTSIKSTHTHAFLNAHLNFLARIITPQRSSLPAHPESPDMHTDSGIRRIGCRQVLQLHCCLSQALRLALPGHTPTPKTTLALTTCQRSRIPITRRVPEEPGLARPPAPRDRNPTNQ